MDIAQYVGLFLQKYQFCFLPNIGYLEIKKKAASFQDNQLESPVYEINYSATRGAIDDSFANFVATNERISIAHAANFIREFCAQAKEDLNKGQEVFIPGYGKFSMNSAGLISFKPDANIQVETKKVPYLRSKEELDTIRAEANSNDIYRDAPLKSPKLDEEIVYKKPQVNWGKILVLAGILVIILAGIIGTIWWLNSQKSVNEQEVKKTEAPAAQPVTKPAVTPTNTPDTSNSSVAPKDTSTAIDKGFTKTGENTFSYNVMINTYDNQARADKRVAQLKSFGTSAVSTLKQSDNLYYVVYNASSGLTDTNKVVDSLRKMYNPSGKAFIVH